MALQGKKVIITGASSGIGRDLCLRFAAEGAEVHALGRNAERLAALTDAGEVNVHSVDLTDDAAMGGTIDVLKALGPIDILLHSAGVVTLGPVEDAQIADLDLNYQVNLRAPFMLTSALLGRVIEAKGQVVLVNSGAGLNARANWAHYAASKHGLKALADSLRDEVKSKGVRVLSIYPGRTATPMQERVRELEGKTYDPEAFVQTSDVTEMVMTALALPRTAHVIDINVRPG